LSWTVSKHGHHRQFLFLIGWLKQIFSSETAWPNESKILRSIYGRSSIKIAHFVQICLQTWPPQAILVIGRFLKKLSPLKPSSQMNRNLVGSAYVRFCIRFPQNKMKGERPEPLALVSKSHNIGEIIWFPLNRNHPLFYFLFSNWMFLICFYRSNLTTENNTRNQNFLPISHGEGYTTVYSSEGPYIDLVTLNVDQIWIVVNTAIVLEVTIVIPKLLNITSGIFKDESVWGKLNSCHPNSATFFYNLHVVFIFHSSPRTCRLPLLLSKKKLSKIIICSLLSHSGIKGRGMVYGV
jgi:hypothetical protein